MSKKVNRIHKKMKSHDAEPAWQENPQNPDHPEFMESGEQEESEEYEVDPIEIPDVFPEELSEDMETDIPDAPDPKPEKKTILQKFLDFFRDRFLEEDDEEDEEFEDEDEFEENEDDEEFENSEEFSDTELQESENSQDFAEFYPEEAPEHPEIPEDSEISEIPEIDSQRIFPDLDEFGFPEISGDFLPDPEFLDGLPTPEYFEELDAIELPDPPENPTEVVDAPEIMPDGMVSDPEHMIFIPDEIAFSQDADADIDAESELQSGLQTNPDADQKLAFQSGKPKPRIFGKLIGVLVGAACIAGIVIAFRNGVFDEREIYYMPDLTGENYMEFQNVLQLDFQIDNAEYSAYEKDRIYHQDIPAGTEIKPGQTVHIDVSLGLATAIIPDVRNYQLAYAQKTLEQAGFRTEIQYEMSQGGTESGNVIRTEPVIGQEITIDQPVILYISRGSDNQAALVPNVVGMDLEAAKILCEEAGLSVETEAVPSLEAENIVVGQSLAQNTQVNFDTIILLSYSNSEQPEGIIHYQLQFPAYANGRFVLDFIDEEGTVIASSTVVAGFSAGSDIPVPGHGLHNIRVVLNNEATADQATIGTYNFDFTTGIYEILTEDIQTAFEAVNGIG